MAGFPKWLGTGIANSADVYHNYKDNIQISPTMLYDAVTEIELKNMVRMIMSLHSAD